MRQTYTGSQKPDRPGPDKRLRSPASARNITPILEVMRRTMPAEGLALEIASGTGEHCARFAAEFAGVTWLPTDVEPQRLDSIRAWIAAADTTNVHPPQILHAGQPDWPFDAGSMTLAVTVNLLHLISLEVTTALFAGIQRVLQPGGQWFLYGPFSRDGAFVSEGDKAFHLQLIRQNATIGYKDTKTVAALARQHDLPITACHAMPANNLMYVLQAPGGATTPGRQ